jgi:hypothetical protein
MFARQIYKVYICLYKSIYKMKTLKITKIILVVVALAVVAVAAYFMVNAIPAQYKTS